MGRFQQDVVERVEALHFAAAQVEDNVAAYEEYLFLYSEGRFSEDAKERIEDLYLMEAEKQGTVAAYRRFLERYSDGSSADKVRIRLEEIYPSFSNSRVLEIPGISAIAGSGTIEPDAVRIFNQKMRLIQ